ncbi:MAG: sigma-70 family RNA polymerase sigma factor [Kofleriaceae bacterium]|nr:sigma-70 family RNA polymerase sigma factor [Kofleriaceae bacterium]
MTPAERKEIVMCTQWRSIESALRSKVLAAGPGGFREIAEGTALTLYQDAESLLHHLHERGGSDEERDHLLAALVAMARGRDRRAALARDVLWLAMWPGLTALLKRAEAWGVEDDRELAGEIVLRFAETIEDVDLSRCSRVAATLILNTRRGLVEMVKGRANQRAVEEPLADESAVPASPSQVEAAAQAIAELRARDPEEAELVVACVIEGVTTREVAERSGVEREAVKKRLRRALDRMRTSMSATRESPGVPICPENPLIEGRGNASREGANDRDGGRKSAAPIECERLTGKRA